MTLTHSAETVEVYDFLELTLEDPNEWGDNPFTDRELLGTFTTEGQPPISVTGFCDSADGRTFRLRFLPTRPGDYAYALQYRADGRTETFWGRVTATPSGRRGLLRVDPAHPAHFLWEGTGEHFFYNGTTAYFLLGWDDATMLAALDRLARLGINRIRLALTGRVESGQSWFENANETADFTFCLNPWVAAQPDSVSEPGFDVTRFHPPHWQKLERLLRAARDRDIAISVIFYLDGAKPGVDPFGPERMGGEDERRYYQYAVSRLAAFSNVMWDVTNEWKLFRTEDWAKAMGSYLKSQDPYGHLTSIHGHEDFPYRTEPWADYAIFQTWDEYGGYDFMLKNRREQAETGRVIPQVNDEYGYEDHYPQGWGENRVAPSRDADSRRRLAWEIAFAGGYQTTGERATLSDRPDDAGGGWINGRGDDSMTMLEGYARLRRFFEAFEWWKTEPISEGLTGAGYALGEPGRQYAVYSPRGESLTLSLPLARFAVRAYDPNTGAWAERPDAEGPLWTAPDQRNETAYLLIAG